MNMTNELLELFYVSAPDSVKVNFSLKLKLSDKLKKENPVKRDVYKVVADEHGCIQWRSIERLANTEHFKEHFMQEKAPNSDE